LTDLPEENQLKDRVQVDPILQLVGISKHYAGVQALNDVSMSVFSGEIVCLVGENGAGKSTLAAIAAGLVIPDSGKIFVGGQEIRFNQPADAERAGIRLASQELQLCPELDVATNVLLGQFPKTKAGFVNYPEMRRIAGQRLAALGLSDIDLSANVGKLPIVYRAFIQIARSLTPGAKVLITDEPTAPMSNTEAYRLLDLLKTISGQGVGIVFVSHRMDEVLTMGDRCIVLRDGKLADEMNQEDGSKERILTAMLGHSVGLSGEKSAIRTVGMDSEIGLSVKGLSAGDDIVDVNIEVRMGEIVGVYGIAGSGRDLLGMTIFGSNKPSGGEIKVNGKVLHLGKISSSVASGLGYVPAERRTQGLLLERSIRENLSLASLKQRAKYFFLQKSLEKLRVNEWIDRLSIKSASSEALVLSLSGGNQQKVLLSRWLLAGCRVLVLDDPTRGVDVGSKLEIYELLQNLAHIENRAILVITSDIEEVLKISDRVQVIRKGKIMLSAVDPSHDEVARAAYLESAS
jgi:ABC-type sugar transport system ATPase subunit